MEKVLDYIRRNRMINTGEKIVVGVSGGPDSVCLLFLLNKYRKLLGITLQVVHMEHGIRGKDSLKDAAFVENLCEKWEIPCRTFHRAVPKIAKEWKCSAEEAGRKVRYEAFEEVRKEIGAGRIAVAHNQDDQAETVLFHLVRGSGLTGLCGMRPVRGRIIRPLLCLTREEIEDILKSENIPWRIDATNHEADYARNRIRLYILPLLREELNQKAKEHMAGAAQRLAVVEDYLNAQAAVKRESLCHWKDGMLYLDRKGFSEEEEALKDYILRGCIGEVMEDGSLKDFSAVHVEDLKGLAERQSGRRLNLPGGLLVWTEGKYLVFKRSQRGASTFGRELKAHGYDSPCGQDSENIFLPVSLEWPKEVRYGKYRIFSEIFLYKNEIIPEKMYTKWFDYDTIKNTLQIRHRMSGDYLTINGNGSRKSLKRYLIDEKIPAREREELCLLADGSHIVWVVGRRISEAYKVTEKTTRVLKVQVMEE